MSGAGTRAACAWWSFTPQPRQINLRRFFWREFTLAGARLYVRTDFGKAVSQLDDSTIPAERLISKVMPLAEALAAFEALEAAVT